MMKRLLGVLLFVGVILSGVVFANNSTYAEITQVKIDGDTVNPSGATVLDVTKGDELSVKVSVLGLLDANNVQIEAALRGFDRSEERRVGKECRL